MKYVGVTSWWNIIATWYVAFVTSVNSMNGIETDKV
jgi:hypothetical protein